MSTYQVAGKILFLRFSRLGRIPSALNAALLLQEKGSSVLIYEFGGNDKASNLIYADSLNRIRLANNAKNLRTIRVFLQALIDLFFRIYRQGKPRLIFSNGLQEQVLALTISFLFGVPFAAYVHEIFDTKSAKGWNRFFLTFEKFALRKAAFLIFPEEERANILKLRYNLQNPAFTVFNCPRLRNERKKKNQSQNPEKMLLYLGGIGKNNGLEMALEALALTQNISFVLCGWSDPSYLKLLKNKVRNLNLGARVFFRDAVDETKWEVLDQADFSYCVYEPTELRFKHIATASNKLMEAMAAGLPVLVPDTPSFQALVAERELGECVALDPTAIASKLQYWLASPEVVQRQSKNATQSHEELLHFEKQFEPVLRYVKKFRDPHGFKSVRQ